MCGEVWCGPCGAWLCYLSYQSHVGPITNLPYPNESPPIACRSAVFPQGWGLGSGDEGGWTGRSGGEGRGGAGGVHHPLADVTSRSLQFNFSIIDTRV